MVQGLAEIDVATKILVAVAAKTDPSPDDVARLRNYVPSSEALSLDELACEAIQRALRERAKARTKAEP